MKKVCIIVDHPSRDLVGITYFAQKIIKKNYEIILVPMYHWHEILLIRPEIVIVNHGRIDEMHSSGINLILKYCEQISIECLILDNEGALVDKKIYKKILNDFPYNHKYLLWGNDKKKLIKKKNFIVTGHPRYDLYNDNKFYSKFSSKISNKISENYILINTSFPGCNPLKKIHWDSKNFDKTNDTHILKSLKIEKQNFIFFIDCIDSLFEKFKKEKFIIRPHPFESLNFYKKKYQKFKNVKILNDSDVFYYIKNSKFVINSNCQTSLETSVMGKNFINISTKYFEKRSKIINDLKKPVKTKQRFNLVFKKYLKHKKISENKSILNKIYPIINNIKEKSYPLIQKIIIESKTNPKDQDLIMLLKLILKIKGPIACFKFLFKLFFKLENIFALKSLKGRGI